MKFTQTSIWLWLVGFLLMQCDLKKDAAPFYHQLLTRSWKVTNQYINGAEQTAIDYSGYRYIFSKSGSYSIITALSVNSGCWELDARQAIIILDKGTPGELTYLITHMNNQVLEIETTLPATLKDPQQKFRIRMSS